MVSTSLLITTTDYLPGSVDGSLISRSWFVVLSPAASLFCAISSLHHQSGHEIPEFGSLFAIDCSELPLPAKANNASNIMRHGVGTEFHGRLLSSVIKYICLVMVALPLFQQKKSTTFISQFMVGGGGAFEETYFQFLIVDCGCVEIHVTLYLVSEGYVFKFTRHPLLFFLSSSHTSLALATSAFIVHFQPAMASSTSCLNRSRASWLCCIALSLSFSSCFLSLSRPSCSMDTEGLKCQNHNLTADFHREA